MTPLSFSILDANVVARIGAKTRQADALIATTGWFIV